MERPVKQGRRISDEGYWISHRSKGLDMPGLNFTYDLADLISSLVRVLVIVGVTAVVLLVLRRIIPKVVHTRLPRRRRETPQALSDRSQTIAVAIRQVVSFLAWIIAFVMILGTVGVNIMPILTALGVAGLALGLAGQSIMRDYLHGFFILTEDWYRVGEVASMAGVAGLVVDVNMRRTVLRDLNGTMHVVPNSKVEQASNLTRDWARINLDISVAYSTNLEHAIEVINRVCQEMKDDSVWGPDLLTTPKVERVDELGDSGITIKILGDTKPIRQWALTGELRMRLKNRFDQESIEIPWPHTKVYFGNSPSVN